MNPGKMNMGMAPIQRGMNRTAPAEPTAPAPAPNYREAQLGEGSCLDCQHYDAGARMCNLYQFGAKPHFTCDSYAPAGEAEAPAGEAPPQALPPQTEEGY